jgi:hypothetical protein
MFTIKFTPVGGNPLWWNPHFGQPNTTPKWQPNNTIQYSEATRSVRLKYPNEFKWSSGMNQPKKEIRLLTPMDAQGNIN